MKTCNQRQCCYPLNTLFNIMFLALICRRFLCYGPSYTHCCRALTLALARLSCIIIILVIGWEGWLFCTGIAGKNRQKCAMCGTGRWTLLDSTKLNSIDWETYNVKPSRPTNVSWTWSERFNQSKSRRRFTMRFHEDRTVPKDTR